MHLQDWIDMPFFDGTYSQFFHLFHHLGMACRLEEALANESRRKSDRHLRGSIKRMQIVAETLKIGITASIRTCCRMAYCKVLLQQPCRHFMVVTGGCQDLACHGS